MHSHRELTALAAGKAALRWRIARWRQLSPLVKFAALPPGFLLKSPSAPHSGVSGGWLRRGPFMPGAVHDLAGARNRNRSPRG